jgi:hypothetical protein
VTAAELPHVAASFNAAKRLLNDQVYADHRVSFYCGCAFNGQRRTDLGACGLAALPRRNGRSASRPTTSTCALRCDSAPLAVVCGILAAQTQYRQPGERPT